MAAITATGTTELRAMYGGLQAAIGIWAGWAAWKPAAARGALTALLVLPAGLASTRLVGALVAADTSAYTLGALVFETVLASTAAWLLVRAPQVEDDA